MNPLPAHWVDGWWEWMVAASWQLAALVMVVGVVALLLRRRSARFRYALWTLVLIKVFLPTSLALPVVGVGHWAPRPELARVAVVQALDQPAVENPRTPEETSAAASSRSPQTTSMYAGDEKGQASASITPAATTTTRAILFALWAAGGALFALWVVGHYRLLVRRLRDAEELTEGPLAAQLARLAPGQRPPRLLVSDRVVGPCLVGLLHPRLVLPKELPDTLSAQQLQDVLRHELVHWRRRDLLVGWLQMAAQALFWFHPFVWFANAQLSHARECACDEAVIEGGGTPRGYGESLLRVLLSGRGRTPAALGLLGVFERHTRLTQRLEDIMRLETSPRKFGLAGWAFVVLFALVFLPMAGYRGQAAPGAGIAPQPGASETAKDVAAAIGIMSKSTESDRAQLTAAYQLIQKHPKHEALVALVPWLNNNTATKRRSAVYALQMLPWDDATPALPSLRKLLTHKEDMTRGMAALTLASLGDKSSYDAFARMLKDDDSGYARRCAAWALGELADQQAVAALEAARKDRDSLVASNADNALQRLAFLHENEAATGEARHVIQGIWIISGSTINQDARLDRAVEEIRMCSRPLRERMLQDLKDSKVEAIRNSAMVALGRMSELLPH